MHQNFSAKDRELLRQIYATLENISRRLDAVEAELKRVNTPYVLPYNPAPLPQPSFPSQPWPFWSSPPSMCGGTVVPNTIPSVTTALSKAGN